MLYGRLPTSHRCHVLKVVLFINTIKNLTDRSDNIIENPLVTLFPNHPGVKILPAMLLFRIPCCNPMIMKGGLANRNSGLEPDLT